MIAMFDPETAAQLISMKLATFGNIPFQILSPSPKRGQIGIRLHPDEQYCFVEPTGFLAWVSATDRTLDQIRAALAAKRKQARSNKF